MKNLIVLLVLSFNLIYSQSDSSIVLLTKLDSTIVQDVHYATTNNFTGKILYPTSKVYIRKIVGENLARADRFLEKNFNLRIKIFDGFRPRSVQKIMWQIYPDPNYVANPSTGSRHNRGAAVDVTLIANDGKELDMGTEYDNFTLKAHYISNEVNNSQAKNRKILHEAMLKFGFEQLSTEWWHFDFNGWKTFSVLEDFPK